MWRKPDTWWLIPSVLLLVPSCREMVTKPPLGPPAEANSTLVIADQFDVQPMADAFPYAYSIDSTGSTSSTPHYDVSLLDGIAIVCRDHFKPIDLWWTGPNGLVMFHLEPPLLLNRKGPGTYKDKKGQIFANSVYESLKESVGQDALGHKWGFVGKFSAYCKNGDLEIGPIVFGGQMLVALSPIDPPYRIDETGDGPGCDTQFFYDPDQPCPGDDTGGTGGGGDPGSEPTATPGDPELSCTSDTIVLEISYDGGVTWSVWWEGEAQICS